MPSTIEKLFAEIVKWTYTVLFFGVLQVVGWTLAEDLVTYITKGINNFRKVYHYRVI